MSPGPARRSALVALLLSSSPLQAQWIAPEDLAVGIAGVSEGRYSTAFTGTLGVGPFVIDADYGASSNLAACRPNADAVESCYDLFVGVGGRHRFGARTRVLRPYLNILAGSYSTGSGVPDPEYVGERFCLLWGAGVVVRRSSSHHGLKVAFDWRRVFSSPARSQARVGVAYLFSVDVGP